MHHFSFTILTARLTDNANANIEEILPEKTPEWRLNLNGNSLDNGDPLTMRSAEIKSCNDFIIEFIKIQYLKALIMSMKL